MPVIDKTDDRPLWGVQLFVNIDPDGWLVGDVYNTPEEAEKAKKDSMFRLETIRIQ